MAGKHDNITLNNGFVCNALSESVSRGIAPGFPYCVEITNIDRQDFYLSWDNESCCTERV